jgi:hypothetical protein
VVAEEMGKDGTEGVTPPKMEVPSFLGSFFGSASGVDVEEEDAKDCAEGAVNPPKIAGVSFLVSSFGGASGAVVEGRENGIAEGAVDPPKIGASFLVSSLCGASGVVVDEEKANDCAEGAVNPPKSDGVGVSFFSAPKRAPVGAGADGAERRVEGG